MIYLSWKEIYYGPGINAWGFLNGATRFEEKYNILP